MRSTTTRHLALAGLFAALAPAAFAQVPFQDGELLLHHAALGQQSIYRIDPTSGNGTVLVQGHHYGGQAGWMTFDRYRGGLLLSAGFGQLGGIFQPHLTRVDSAGNLSSLGFQGQYLRAMHAVGDGRVYFQRHGLPAPHELEVLDAQNQVHVLTDVGTGLPIDLDAQFTYYSPEQNALIVIGPTGNCSPTSNVVVFRVPLTPNGLQVNGPITCAGWDFPAQSEVANGLDRLPGGELLMVVSHTFVGDQTLVRIDPSGPTLSLWAETTQSDFNGLAWSTRLGRAVLVDDYFSVLRLFDQGHQSGPNIWGDELTVNVPVGGHSGYAWTTSMIDVNLLGPGCSGLAFGYGQGSAGFGGIVPKLGAAKCPAVGTVFQLTITSGRGGRPGLLVAGPLPAAVPLFGGTLLVAPPWTTQGFVLSGPAGAPGAGNATVPIPLPNDPGLVGVPYYFQAGIVDAGAVAGVALTNGVEMRAE